MIYEGDVMRRFAGIKLADDRIPDESTIPNLGHPLERHGLTEVIFAEVNAYLACKGITLRSGTLMNAMLTRRAVINQEQCWGARLRDVVHK